MTTPRTRYVLGIDIGGQSIKPELYTLINNTIAETSAWRPAEAPKTQLGTVAHVAQIADIIATAHVQAQQLGGTLIATGIGSPGRFRADGTIKPGTNANLGNTVDEFDNFPLQAAYEKALAARVPELAGIALTVGNDGHAMLAGMVSDILHPDTSKPALYDQHGHAIDASTLHRKRVALLGIGTGLGHAIADVDEDGSLRFITDGHASKLRLAVDASDWDMVRTAASRMNTGHKTEVMMFPRHTVRAEDVLRDPVLRALAGVRNAKDINWQHNLEHAAIVRFAGKYMARLIALIRSGESRDVEPGNGWSAAEKAEAARTEYYLVGGGLGAQPLGGQIIYYAQQQLKRLRINEVKLVHYTRPNPTARAAAAMIPIEILSGRPLVAV